jgi:hypothetical protein
MDLARVGSDPRTPVPLALFPALGNYNTWGRRETARNSGTQIYFTWKRLRWDRRSLGELKSWRPRDETRGITLGWDLDPNR